MNEPKVTNNNGKHKLKRSLIHLAVRNNLLRGSIISLIQKRMWRTLVEKNAGKFPHKVQMDKNDIAKALFQSTDRNIRKKLISKQWLEKFADIHIENLETQAQKMRETKERIGFEPPLFITISPTKKCNLRCPGCYACSSTDTRDKLDIETFDRILTEQLERWGSYITVISGGEPFLWEDKGKDLLDMAKKHHRHFFMVYTNGTLIDKSMAKRLEQLGNVTPAISIEGYEKETDQRRGKGVYKKILEAFDNLREVGVPFGISITAMKQNWELVSSEDFLDYWFNQECATYGWIFQFMPIGDRSSFDMVVPPEQRMVMLKRLWEVIREKKLFLADFWNSGTATSGCIAGGRPGGYFYVTWSGDITPCVFVPYSETNIYDIYKNGGTLDDVILTPMMQQIREWQASYGFTLYHSFEEECDAKNWLAPCFFRDHYNEFLEVANTCTLKPIDPGAEEALTSGNYHKMMLQYGNDFEHINSPFWNRNYLMIGK